MKLWYPSRAQWWVIWAVYVIALLASVDWTSPGPLFAPPGPGFHFARRGPDQFDPSMSSAAIVTHAVVGGALAIWWLQGNRSSN